MMADLQNVRLVSAVLQQGSVVRTRRNSAIVRNVPNMVMSKLREMFQKMVNVENIIHSMMEEMENVNLGIAVLNLDFVGLQKNTVDVTIVYIIYK